MRVFYSGEMLAASNPKIHPVGKQEPLATFTDDGLLAQSSSGSGHDAAGHVSMGFILRNLRSMHAMGRVIVLLVHVALLMLSAYLLSYNQAMMKDAINSSWESTVVDQKTGLPLSLTSVGSMPWGRCSHYDIITEALLCMPRLWI